MYLLAKSKINYYFQVCLFHFTRGSCECGFYLCSSFQTSGSKLLFYGVNVDEKVREVYIQNDSPAPGFRRDSAELYTKEQIPPLTIAQVTIKWNKMVDLHYTQKKRFFNGSSEWSKVLSGTFCYLNQAKGSPNYTQLWRTIKGSSFSFEEP